MSKHRTNEELEALQANTAAAKMEQVIIVEQLGDGWRRLYCEIDSDDCDREVAEANAKLIAAAPDLLQQCIDNGNLISDLQKHHDEAEAHGAVMHERLEAAEREVERLKADNLTYRESAREASRDVEFMRAEVAMLKEALADTTELSDD